MFCTLFIFFLLTLNIPKERRNKIVETSTVMNKQKQKIIQENRKSYLQVHSGGFNVDEKKTF